VNRGLPASQLLAHFRRVGLDWQLNDEVRRMVTFRSFDLRSGMGSLGPFDLVFCRNVLIYFDLPTRQKILTEIHGTLFRGGHLLLSGSENALPAGDRYRRCEVEKSIVYEVQ
jgi:chemotaxis protein methyltransferase CheR